MKNFSFSREKRICEKNEFSNVFKNTEHVFRSKFFSVLIKKNTSNQSRLGLVVAKKNVKTATKRNFLKRKIRENFRKTKIDKGLDIVVIVKKYENDKIEIQKCLENHWNLLKKPQY